MKVNYIQKNVYNDRPARVNRSALLSFKGNSGNEGTQFSYSDAIFTALCASPILAGMFIYRGIKKGINSNINKLKSIKNSFFKEIENQTLASYLKSSSAKAYKGSKEKLKNFGNSLKTKWENFKKPS